MEWITNFPLEYGFGVAGLMVYLFAWFFLFPSDFAEFKRTLFTGIVLSVANLLLTVQIIVWIVMLIKIVWSM